LLSKTRGIININYCDIPRHGKPHISHFRALCGNSIAMFCTDSDTEKRHDCAGNRIGAWW